MKTTSKKWVKVIIVLLFCILAILSTFVGGYYFFINKSYNSYEKDVTAILATISTANKGTEVFTQKGSINVALVQKELPKRIDTLIRAKEKLQTLVPTSKYQKDQDSLIKGLNNNIMMYKQVIAILNTPQSPDIEKSTVDLQQFEDDCINSYALFQMKDADLTLPGENLNFIESVISYTANAIRSKKDNEIKQSQATEFIGKVDLLVDQFENTTIDFSLRLPKVRSGEITYDTLLDDIDRAKEQLLQLKKDITNTTIPSNKISLSKFLSAAEEYDFYLQDFKYNVINEKFQSSSKGNSSFPSDYPSSREKFESFSKKYADFSNLYSQYKTSEKNSLK